MPTSETLRHQFRSDCVVEGFLGHLDAEMPSRVRDRLFGLLCLLETSEQNANPVDLAPKSDLKDCSKP